MSTIETTKIPDLPKWESLPDKQTVARTIESLKSRGINAELVGTQQEALRVVAGKIPEGAEVMTGASTSLDQIGFTELLKSGKHHWKNIKDEVMSDKDPGKQERDPGQGDRSGVLRWKRPGGRRDGRSRGC